MSHLIIGLCGDKQHGKSTVAKHLCQKHGFVEITVAEPLKEIIGRQLFYFSHEQLHDPKEKEKIDERWGVSPRRVFQAVGRFMRDYFGEDFWSKRVAFRIIELLARYPKGVRVVVSDCRFPRELELIEDVGGVTCRVVKTGVEKSDFDESETALEEVETGFTLEAAPGDIEGLLEQTDRMVEKLGDGQSQNQNV